MVAKIVAAIAALISTTVMASDTITIVEFASPHCPPCQKLQPVIDQLINEGWIIRQVDVERESDFAARWRIAHLPTLIVIRDGREIDRIIGAMPLDTLRQRLEESRNSRSGASENTLRAAQQPSMQSTQTLGPIVRGQSPILADASRQLHDLARLATQATHSAQSARATHSSLHSMSVDPSMAVVRICVDDGHSEAFGTGTIIDTVGNDALVITCGHIFREGQGRSPATVDIFVNGSKRSYPGNVVYFRADETDIGLLAFRADQPLPKAPIISQGELLSERQRVFSYGCDGGADPSRRDTVITKLNGYLGPANVEIAGAPVQGRSGGGLFDDRGRLIGVCYAADKQLDEGLYSGPEVIYEALAAIGAQRLFLPATRSSQMTAEVASELSPSKNVSTLNAQPMLVPQGTDLLQGQGVNAQITATIQQPGQPDRTIRISNASPEMLQLLEQYQVR